MSLVPEHTVDGTGGRPLNFRADHRCFYSMELHHDQPLMDILTEWRRDGSYRATYELAWFLLATWRRQHEPTWTFEDMVDELPVIGFGAFANQLADLVLRAITPTAPTAEGPPKKKPIDEPSGDDSDSKPPS